MTAIPQQKRVVLRPVESNSAPPCCENNLDESFQQLILVHHRSVRLFLAQYIHCADQVDDVSQEVFLAAYKQMSQFRCESKVSTWLFGIARNKALHFLRSELRRQRYQHQFAVAERMRRSIEVIDRGATSEPEERVQALLACMEHLPDHLKQLVRQFYFDGVAAVTIAEHAGQTDGSVRMKLRRIRKRLGACIDSRIAGSTRQSEGTKQ